MNAITKKDTQWEAPVVQNEMDQSAALMQVIERAAMNPDVDLDRMERLFDMAERIRSQRAEQAFAAAMSRAQSKMRRVEADATNPQTRSKYASYGAIDRAIRPLYAEEGFSVSFDTEPHPDADWITVVAYVSHSEGHTRKYSQPMPADGKGAKGGDVMTKTHAMGSAQTYGMRYLIKKIWNIAIGVDDDDGNAASPVQKITSDQVKTLEDMLADTGVDRQKFIGWLFAGAPGKHELAGVQAGAMYDRAVNALKAKQKGAA